MIRLTKSQERHRALKVTSELMPIVLERLERLEHHNKLLNAWLVMDKDPHTKIGLVREVTRHNEIRYVRIDLIEFKGNDCTVKPMHPANMSRTPESAPVDTEIKFIFKDFDQHIEWNNFDDRAVNEIQLR